MQIYNYFDKNGKDSLLRGRLRRIAGPAGNVPGGEIVGKRFAVTALITGYFGLIIGLTHGKTVLSWTFGGIRENGIQNVENEFYLLKPGRLQLQQVLHLHEGGDNGDVVLGSEQKGAPLLGAGFAVVEPHLLLGVNEDKMVLFQVVVHEITEGSVHVGGFRDKGDNVNVAEHEAVQAGHHEVGPLADGDKSSVAGFSCKRAVYTVVKRIKMVASDESRAL